MIVSSSGRRRYRAECSPARVGVALAGLCDELVEQPFDRPTGDEAQCYAELAARARWRIGWHERVRDQWSRLGAWCLATGQPDAVVRAVFHAEWTASSDALAAEVRATEYERRAVKALLKPSRAGSGARVVA